MWSWIFKKHYEIYTDGSVKESRAAWAYVITHKGRIVHEAAGKDKHTTCNQMEFQAAIEALKLLPPGSKVTLYSDSRILITTMNVWRLEWKTHGWCKKTGRPVPHLEQVRILDELHQQHEITWKWIKAHSGIPFNERCDELCIQTRG